MDSFYLPTPVPFTCELSVFCLGPLPFKVRRNPRVTYEGAITQLGQSPSDLEDPSPKRSLSYLAPGGEGKEDLGDRKSAPLHCPSP